ncbi:MAG TPA: hypothetical protein VMA95_12280 [Streptosporangiaceae bacterium]|nr:hypothetical protein [Streptosporangiaceae bacterium]
MVVLASAVAAGSAVLLASATGAGAALAAGKAGQATGPWGTATEVPGLAGLNVDGRAEVLSVSCGAPGDCAAGGSYQDSRRDLQGFVISEQNGTWGTATEVPGLAALNVSGQAEVMSVSCDAVGDCAAGGYYYDKQGQQGFVVNEQDGTWGTAIEIPGLAALSAGFAEVLSMSCAAAGQCAAGGYYYNQQGQQGFVVSELDGTWGNAIEVPGLAALNADGSAEVLSVSCDPTGDCVAGGTYKDARKRHQGFVASEAGGTWGNATYVPGLVAMNQGGQAATTSVWCPSAGTCAAGGYYKGKRTQQGFVVNEQNGTWARAIEVPGLSSLNAGYAAVSSVSCTQAGDCAAGGYYNDHHGHAQGFVAGEVNGTWGSAAGVPGLPMLNAGGTARISSLSCSPAGNCAAGGNYLNHSGEQEAFVVSRRNGKWGKAIEVPGLGSLNAGVAQAWSVSCGQAGNCTAGGFYQDRKRKTQGFLVSQT